MPRVRLARSSLGHNPLVWNRAGPGPVARKKDREKLAVVTKFDQGDRQGRGRSEENPFMKFLAARRVPAHSRPRQLYFGTARLRQALEPVPVGNQDEDEG